jgi:hypothetical protein
MDLAQYPSCCELHMHQMTLKTTKKVHMYNLQLHIYVQKGDFELKKVRNCKPTKKLQ